MQFYLLGCSDTTQCRYYCAGSWQYPVEVLLEILLSQMCPPALTHAVVWAHTWLLREPVPFVHTCSDLCWCCSGIFETKPSLVWVTGETSVRPAGLALGLPRSRHWQPPSVRSPAGSRAERGAGARRRSARLLWCDHESKPRRDRLVWGVFRKNASLRSRILDRWSTRTYCVA